MGNIDLIIRVKPAAAAAGDKGLEEDDSWTDNKNDTTPVKNALLSPVLESISCTPPTLKDDLPIGIGRDQEP